MSITVNESDVKNHGRFAAFGGAADESEGCSRFLIFESPAGACYTVPAPVSTRVYGPFGITAIDACGPIL